MKMHWKLAIFAIASVIVLAAGRPLISAKADGREAVTREGNGREKDAQRCARPEPGSVVEEPAEIRSHDGTLMANLRYRQLTGADGLVEYCYLSQEGGQAPTLRAKPGDLVVLRLKNELGRRENWRCGGKAPGQGKDAAMESMGSMGSMASGVSRFLSLAQMRP